MGSTLAERLKRLEKSIIKNSSAGEDFPSKGIAWSASADIVGCLAVGCFFGWFFENIFPLHPWGLIIGFLFGSVAGLLNVYRSLTKEVEKGK